MGNQSAGPVDRGWFGKNPGGVAVNAIRCIQGDVLGMAALIRKCKTGRLGLRFESRRNSLF